LFLSIFFDFFVCIIIINIIININVVNINILFFIRIFIDIITASAISIAASATSIDASATSIATSAAFTSRAIGIIIIVINTFAFFIKATLPYTYFWSNGMIIFSFVKLK